MFVTWSCGCVGMQTPAGDYVIKACDDDCSLVGLYPRAMNDKVTVPLDSEQTADLAGELDRLLVDGARYREIRGLLGIK